MSTWVCVLAEDLAQTRTRDALDAGKITGLYFPGALVGAAPRL